MASLEGTRLLGNLLADGRVRILGKRFPHINLGASRVTVKGWTRPLRHLGSRLLGKSGKRLPRVRQDAYRALHHRCGTGLRRALGRRNPCLHIFDLERG